MPNITIQVHFDPAAMAKTLRGRWQKGLTELSAQVLDDCNAFARDASGQLMESARGSSNLAAGRLVWNTPYARRVYYTGTPLRGRNPAASLRWCEKAKAARLSQWRKLAAQKLGGVQP